MMGKKNRQKTKWKPLKLVDSESQSKSQNDSPSRETNTGRQYVNTQHSTSEGNNSIEELPSMNSGPTFQYQYTSHPPPFYTMIGGWSMPQYPRFYYPTMPTSGYRPLQPLEWFNPRLPANCQYYYAMEPPPRTPNPNLPNKTHYHNQAPFYWNSILLNPYNNLINQIEENPSSSNYVYPGHYYGPASFNQVNQRNHVTTPQQQPQPKNIDQHKPKKKRKRKRKRKLQILKINQDEDQMSSCSTQMEDESTASSETRGTRESSNDQVVNGKMQVDEQCQACDDVKSEIPDGGCKLVLDSNSPPNQPIGNDNLLSREQLPPLPLVGDLFALNLVDDIVSRALEIVKEKEEIQLVKEKQQQNEEIRVEKCEQDVDVIAQKESASLEDKILDIPTNLSPGNEISENNLSHEKDNAPLDFYLPEDDDSEDSELQELMGNSRNSISPTQSGFRPLDEEDTDDAIDLSKADDSTTPERVSPNSDESPQIYPNRSQVGSQPVNWLDCNGFPETNSESPQERELVTEIVFISETSFMDENRPSTHNGYCDDEEQGEMGEGRLDDVGQSYQVGNEGEVYPGQDEDDVIQSDLVLGSSGVLDFQVQENEESGNDQRQRNVEIQQVQDLENSRIQNFDFGEMNRGFQLDENDEIENVQFVKGTEIQDDQFSKMIEIQGDQFSEKIGIQGDQSLENNKIQDIEPFEKSKIQDIESFEENKIQDIESFEKNKIQDIESFEETKIQDVQSIEKKEIQDIEPFEKCKIQDIAPFEKNKIQDAQSIEKNENQDVTCSVNNNPRAIEISENKEKQSAGSIETKKELRLSEINEDDKIIDVTRSLSTSNENIQADDLDEELIEERYMDDDANHELFYDPLKFKDYYQICTNIEVPDSPSLDKVNKTPFNSPIIHQPPPKPPRLRTSSRESSIPKDCDLANTLTRAEIVVHEMDDVSECGSEDVDTIGHQFQKSEDDKHIYVNQLSLAAELLKTQQSIPYDQEFKPLSEGEGSSNDAAYLQTCASTSHSNRDVYDKYYGSVIIPLQDVTINQPQKIKEVSDSGVQSEESADEDDISKRKGEKPTGRPIGYKVIENKAKPLSAMLKGKGDPLCLCCSVM